MKKWIYSVTAHGWEDDIDCLVFLSDRLLDDSEIAMEYNTRFAGRYRGDIKRKKDAFLPVWSNQDSLIDSIEVDEDGYYQEQHNPSRQVWFRHEEIEI